ncbi:glycoside hydrolase family 17 protein [Diaporthe eres]|uniref:Probable beta-glucosidase btgE n=1 Tax=Diaporthe vaccinii TaxID=105482 RepID=A0ABR4F0D3_9PEZI|nr:glycoside hydrolase family 17 protein [Diaporthe eres]
MKTSSLVAAALLGGANAHAHRRAHDLFNKRANETEVCVPGCTTYYTTVTGTDFIWQPTPNAPAKTTSSAVITPSSEAVTPTTSAATAPVASTPAVVPTPIAQTVPTPGTYTFPATTMTVTETTSAVVPSTTAVPPGTHTLGGVTTIVETATTVVCPYASVSTQSGGVVTSLIQTTTYVCPSAGTYTIAPTTVTVTAPTETVTVPVVTTYLPGTYTAPAVTTEVTTETVVYCPFEGVEPTAATTSSAVVVPSASSVAIPPVSSAVIPPVSSVVPPTTSQAPVPTTSSTSTLIPVTPSASSSSSSTAASSTPTGTLGGGGGLWAMTYTPYDANSGECKTADVVDADVSSIAASGFTTLRVYSTDCDTLPLVGDACSKYGVKMIVGIFISEYGCSNGSPDVDTQISALKEWGQWDLVELMAVGNEALYNGYCTAQELVDLISHVKGELTDYTGPYTTTDIVGAWEQEDVQSLVCDAIDVVAANVHSYFNADVLPIDAGKFVKSQIEIVEKACGGKPGYVLECGYPTSGNTNGVNVPSVLNQQTAIASIKETMGDKVVFFSMFDDKWKDDGACNCEKHWGVGNLFGALGLGNGN